jgi:hypothetical protein
MQLITCDGMVAAWTLVLAVDAFQNAVLTKVVSTWCDVALIDGTEADGATEFIVDGANLETECESERQRQIGGWLRRTGIERFKSGSSAGSSIVGSDVEGGWQCGGWMAMWQ